jgi:hypothetical protein
MADVDAIATVLAPLLPPQGDALVVTSGSDDHTPEMARRFGQLTWQRCGVDATTWPVPRASVIVCIDVVHLIAMDVVLALFGGAARALPSGGLLFLHGPFRFHGKYTSRDNEELDLTLRARDPAIGLRDIRELTVAGTRTGIGLEHTVATSPSHHALAFRRRAMLPPTGQFKVF